MYDLAMELRRRASELDAKIAAVKQELQQLIQRRDSITHNTSPSEIERIIEDIKSTELKLEKLQLMRMAVQKPLNEYANNATKKAPLIEEAKKVHEHARGIYPRFPKLQQEAAGLMKELQADNIKMGAIAQKFRNLVGEDLGLPYPIVCWQVEAFAAAEPIKADAYPAWTYISEADIAVKKEEELAAKLKAHEERIKIAEQYAPNCVMCARGDVETKLVVDRRSGHSDSPGQAGTGSMSHHWNLICPKCHTYTTAPIPETNPE